MSSRPANTLPLSSVCDVISASWRRMISPTSVLRHPSLFALLPKPQSVTSFQLTSYTRQYSVTSPHLHVAHETFPLRLWRHSSYLTPHSRPLRATSSQPADASFQTPVLVCDVIQVVGDWLRRQIQLERHKGAQRNGTPRQRERKTEIENGDRG